MISSSEGIATNPRTGLGTDQELHLDQIQSSYHLGWSIGYISGFYAGYGSNWVAGVQQEEYVERHYIGDGDSSRKVAKRKLGLLEGASIVEMTRLKKIKLAVGKDEMERRMEERWTSFDSSEEMTRRKQSRE